MCVLQGRRLWHWLGWGGWQLSGLWGSRISWQKPRASKVVNKPAMSNGGVGGSLRMGMTGGWRECWACRGPQEGWLRLSRIEGEQKAKIKG